MQMLKLSAVSYFFCFWFFAFFFDFVMFFCVNFEQTWLVVFLLTLAVVTYITKNRSLEINFVLLTKN